MDRYALEFKKFMESKNFILNFKENNGFASCQIREELKCGITAEISVYFSEQHSRVDIINFGFIRGIDLSKKHDIYEFLNEMNRKYSFTTFTMTDNTISIGTSYMVQEYSPQITLDYMLNMIQTMNNEYNSFMKLLWA